MVLILVGTFKERPLVGVMGFAGLLFTLVYILRLVQDCLLGEARKEHVLYDITLREAVVLLPLAIAVLLLGLHPGPVLNLLQRPVQELLGQTATIFMTKAM